MRPAPQRWVSDSLSCQLFCRLRRGTGDHGTKDHPEGHQPGGYKHHAGEDVSGPVHTQLDARERHRRGEQDPTHTASSRSQTLVESIHTTMAKTAKTSVAVAVWPEGQDQP